MAGIIQAPNSRVSSSSSCYPPRIRFNSHCPQSWSSLSYYSSIPSLLHLVRRGREPRFISSPVKAAAAPFDPINDGENKLSGVASSGNVFKWAQPVLNLAGNNFLPLALICGVALGFAHPTLGCLADRYYLSKVSTIGTFIISGLTLRSQEIGAAAEAWPVGLFGLASILLLTPAFSRVILQLNLQPSEFVTGLAIFSCMPTSLSSGVALTRLAGGNSALALAVTVVSNLLGIVVVPFTVSKFVAVGVGISIPTNQLLRSLVIMLLIPLILGKVLSLTIIYLLLEAASSRFAMALTDHSLLIPIYTVLPIRGFRAEPCCLSSQIEKKIHLEIW